MKPRVLLRWGDLEGLPAGDLRIDFSGVAARSNSGDKALLLEVLFGLVVPLLSFPPKDEDDASLLRFPEVDGDNTLLLNS